MANMKDIRPAKRALAALDQSEPVVADAGNHRRISKKVNAAIDILVSSECKTIKETAEKVGMARESLSKALSRPNVAEHLRMKVLRSLAMAAARAGADNGSATDSGWRAIAGGCDGERQKHGRGRQLRRPFHAKPR